MSEQLDSLWEKTDATDLEACILWVADDNTKAALELAEKGLAELRALRATIERLAAKAVLVDEARGLLQDILISEGKIIRAITKLEAK